MNKFLEFINKEFFITSEIKFSIFSLLLVTFIFLLTHFLLKFINEQGKLLPRRLTGTSLKYQRKVSVAVKRARHLALLPYVADLLK